MSVPDPARRTTTGVPGFDEVLQGGLLADRLYLVDGNPGAGKTTLAIQFLLEGRRRGERCLYVTLSETAGELRSGAASHGWTLDGIEIFELLAAVEGTAVDATPVMYHPSEVELSETTRKLQDVVREARPQRMVFDSLSELRLLAQDSLRYRRQILALKQFFVGRGCTVLLLDDRTAEGRDLQLQSIAHGVISLDQRAPAYGRALRQLQVVKFRGSPFMSGYQDFDIQRGGLRVFPRLTPADRGAPFVHETVSSGVPGIDALLGGGVDRGTATLLVGPPGTGKSSVAVQYAAAAAARGDHAAVFTFEEAAALLLQRARGMGMEIPLGDGPGEVTVCRVDPGSVAPSEFAAMVRDQVEQHHARIVIIDSLNGYLNAMPEERALTVQLHELLAYLSSHGVATFLVAAQMGMLAPNARTPVDSSYLADTIVMLRMYEHEGRVKKAISVLKKRSGFHEESIRRVEFGPGGIRLSEPLEQLRGVLTGVPVAVDTGRGAAPADDR